MTQINLDKLRAMRDDWRGVLADKTKTVVRLRDDLQALKGAGKKADIDAVLRFYESVLGAGRAAGRVAILDDLIASLGGEAPSVEVESPPSTGGFYIG